MGKVGFGELAFWLVAMRRPTPSETRVFEAVLVALADHGFTPTAIAARLTYLSAPDSLQGALAAGPARRRLAVPRRHRGLRRVPARGARSAAGRPAHRRRRAGTRSRWRRSPRRKAAGRFVPGLGHPVHKVTDPRTPVLIGIAEEEGLRGPHLRLFEAIGRVHEQVLGRRLPLNGAGRLRRGAGRPRAAGRAAPRVRAAGPGGRAARPARRGAPSSDRHGRLPGRRPQRGLRRPVG